MASAGAWEARTPPLAATSAMVLTAMLSESAMSVTGAVNATGAISTIIRCGGYSGEVGCVPRGAAVDLGSAGRIDITGAVIVPSVLLLLPPANKSVGHVRGPQPDVTHKLVLVSIASKTPMAKPARRRTWSMMKAQSDAAPVRLDDNVGKGLEPLHHHRLPVAYFSALIDRLFARRRCGMLCDSRFAMHLSASLSSNPNALLHEMRQRHAAGQPVGCSSTRHFGRRYGLLVNDRAAMAALYHSR
ncbi:hypothetical protein DL765_007991 [Monosporascus sp. GIB2]|nr:hypothetical protein DL765_007991 [Monosporascus sp. GIB2]